MNKRKITARRFPPNNRKKTFFHILFISYLSLAEKYKGLPPASSFGTVVMSAVSGIVFREHTLL